MRLHKIWIIFTKEYDDIIKSKYILFSLIFMPFLMVLVLPLVTYLPVIMDPSAGDPGDLGFLLDTALTSNWSDLDDFQKMFVAFIEMNWIYYLILPMILPTIIAADSFSGERDRGTVEGLIAAPLTETELYLGKISTSLIPTVVSIWFYSIPYALMTNLFSIRVLGYAYFPNLRFFIFVVLLMPLSGLITINIMIWASTRTSTTRDAQQLGSLLILPLMLVLLSVATVAILYSDLYLLLGAIIMLVLSILAVRLGISLLDRERWLSQTP